MNAPNGSPLYQMPATDKHEFDVVWRGSWYRLACLSAHIKHAIPPGVALLLDPMWRETRAPLAEVHFPCHPIAWQRVRN